MKAKLLFVCGIFVLSTLSACSGVVRSTDLSHITFDGVTVGDYFNQVETGRYTVSARYPEKDNTYNYEEWRITVNSGVITEITASFEAIRISVNGREDCDNTTDIIHILGEAYHSSYYDREQGLMQLRYRDTKHGIQCIFVYDKSNERLIWGIAQKLYPNSIL